MEEAEKYCAIEVYQPQYSMVDRKWEQLIRWACAQKMGVMTYGTLGGGILTGKYRELKEYGVDDNRNRFYPYFKEPLFSKVMLLLRTMDQISVERNVPLSQIALNWTLQRPFISSCIIGAQSRDKIEENCKVFEWEQFRKVQMQTLLYLTLMKHGSRKNMLPNHQTHHYRRGTYR